MDSSRTAFVLSGGAALGAVQVGMVDALYARGIRPDLLVGCSVGAINAAFLASRAPTTATVVALAERWRRVRRATVFPLRPLAGLRGLVGRSDHLVASDGLRALLAPDLDGLDMADLAVPLHVVAVDVLTGEELLLSAGPVLEAVLASAAIPSLLPPVRRDGRWLVDGAVADDTPLARVVELGAETIYVLPTGHACALTTPPRSAAGAALHALSLLTHSRLVADIEHHRDRVRLVVLPPPCPLAVSPLDFRRSDALIARARADTGTFLDAGGADRPPLRMRPHSHDPAPAGKTRRARDAHPSCPPPASHRAPTPSPGEPLACTPPASPARSSSASPAIPATTSTPC